MFLTIYILVFIMNSAPPPGVDCITKPYNSTKTVQREERERSRARERARQTERDTQRDMQTHSHRHIHAERTGQ